MVAGEFTDKIFESSNHDVRTYFSGIKTLVWRENLKRFSLEAMAEGTMAAWREAIA